ncbi:MAG: NAD-binding protein [Sandaracinaceae bacterium]|nr:NAD-binding protein [Sandaracinaceae bacterium]
MAGVHEARLITLALIVAGSGTLLYFISNLTALIVEGDLQGLLRRRRMERAIEHLQNHVIVCGIGTTGRHIVRELSTAGTRFVVVDTNRERIEEMVEHMDGELLYILGDATDDAVMERAGITQCHGIIAALSDDRSNLFVTISARALNKTARIVAKAVEASTERKLYRAGADSVVSPNYIGGMRLANEMIRPKTVEFLDRILQDRDGNQLRIEEIAIPEGSSIFGRTLSQTRIRNTGGPGAGRPPAGRHLRLQPEGRHGHRQGQRHRGAGRRGRADPPARRPRPQRPHAFRGLRPLTVDRGGDVVKVRRGCWLPLGPPRRAALYQTNQRS